MEREGTAVTSGCNRKCPVTDSGHKSSIPQNFKSSVVWALYLFTHMQHVVCLYRWHGLTNLWHCRHCLSYKCCLVIAERYSYRAGAGSWVTSQVPKCQRSGGFCLVAETTVKGSKFVTFSLIKILRLWVLLCLLFVHINLMSTLLLNHLQSFHTLVHYVQPVL